MLIAVLARFLFEISMADTDSSSMQYSQKCIPLGLSLHCIHFISLWVDSASTSFTNTQFYDVVHTELSRPHRVGRAFGHIIYNFAAMLFFSSNASLDTLFLFYKTTKPKSIFDLQIFSMPTQTANKRFRTFHRLRTGIKFHFQQDCPLRLLIKTLSTHMGSKHCICFHYLKARVKQAKYLLQAVAYKCEISFTPLFNIC